MLEKILVPGIGYTISKDVRDVARAILPRTKLTHGDVHEFVARNHPEIWSFKTTGGSGATYPKYTFEWMELASA